MEIESIVMYSTGCPRCQVLRKKLAKLPYTVTIIEGEEGIEALGKTSAPILSVGNQIMEYGEAIKWANKQINFFEEVSQDFECESCMVGED